MNESKYRRANRILTVEDADFWRERIRKKSGRGKDGEWSDGQFQPRTALASVLNEGSSVWVFDSKEQILANKQLTDEEKAAAIVRLETETNYFSNLPDKRTGYVGWIRTSWGADRRSSAQGLLLGEGPYAGYQSRH
jgi:hypothetical protein